MWSEMLFQILFSTQGSGERSSTQSLLKSLVSFQNGFIDIPLFYIVTDFPLYSKSYII